MALQGKMGCRSCFNLAYPIENRSKTDRAIDRKWGLIRRLDSRKEASEYPPRPKGMHHSTHKQLSDRIEEYNWLAYARFFGWKGRKEDRCEIDFEELIYKSVFNKKA